MTIEDNDLTGSLDPIFCDVATDYQEIDRFKFPNMRNLESDCLVPPTTKPPGGVETVTENDVTATTSNHTTNNTNDDNGDDHDYLENTFSYIYFAKVYVHYHMHINIYNKMSM